MLAKHQRSDHLGSGVTGCQYDSAVNRTAAPDNEHGLVASRAGHGRVLPRKPRV
jgi:hypothetical protein